MYDDSSPSMTTKNNWFNKLQNDRTSVFDELPQVLRKELQRRITWKSPQSRMGRSSIEDSEDSWNSWHLKKPRGLYLTWVLTRVLEYQRLRNSRKNELLRTNLFRRKVGFYYRAERWWSPFSGRPTWTIRSRVKRLPGTTMLNYCRTLENVSFV